MENITELRDSVAALAQLVDLQGKILSQVNENAWAMFERITEIEQRIDVLEKVKKEADELEGFVLSDILSANK